jgi:hypothetical protein
MGINQKTIVQAIGVAVGTVVFTKFLKNPIKNIIG